MIKSLRIKNFILVKDIEVEFGQGLNVLSGETGAGKSIIAGAFDLVLGQKGRSGLFYDEQHPIYLETVFNLQTGTEKAVTTKLREDGFLDEDETDLIIAREILPDNSSRSFINGKRVTLSVIRELREALIDFHSQRDQIRLFSPAYQLDIIDSYGNLKDKREDYRRLYHTVKNKIKRLGELEDEERRIAEKQRLYDYQIAELEELDLKNDEERELQKELDLLTHAEDIINYSTELQQVFYEKEDSIYDQINSYISQFERYQCDSSGIESVVQSLSSVLQTLNDVRTELRNIRETIDLDKGKLDELGERQNEILRIKNKYKMEVPGILNYLNEMKTAVNNYESCAREIASLKKEIGKLSEELRRKANELSLDRKGIAKIMKDDIVKNIRRLAIPDGNCLIVFDHLVQDDSGENLLNGLDEFGKDKVSFMFSANKGFDLQPLKNAISGGELSRLLLVIKKILAGRLDTFSLVFDEIDSGIGGKTANFLGEFIVEVGRFHQVLCITHLPQIAAYALRHFLIEKKSGSEMMNSNGTDNKVFRKTNIEIRILSEQERKEEIARMLGGSESETAIKHAEELLGRA